MPFTFDFAMEIDQLRTPTATNALGVLPEHVAEIRTQLGQSLAQFGWTLRHTVDPKLPDDEAFSKAYISALEDGSRAITEEIARAILVIGAVLDGADPVKAAARRVTVLATHDIEGAVVLGDKKKCAYPPCQVWFVPTVPWQKYHSLACGHAMKHLKENGDGIYGDCLETLPHHLPGCSHLKEHGDGNKELRSDG